MDLNESGTRSRSRVVLSKMDEQDLEERFRRLHGAATLAGGVADAAAPLLLSSNLKVLLYQCIIEGYWLVQYILMLVGPCSHAIMFSCPQSASAVLPYKHDPLRTLASWQ